MSIGPVGLAPLIVGPLTFAILLLLGLILLLGIARIVFRITWKLVLIGGGILVLLWLRGAAGPPPGVGV